MQRSNSTFLFYRDEALVGDPVIGILPDDFYDITTTDRMEIGSRGNGNNDRFNGDMFAADVRDGISGPQVMHMSASDPGIGFAEGVVPDGSTWVSRDGRTYTVHGGLIEWTAPLAEALPDLIIIRGDQLEKQTIAQGLVIHRARI